MKLLLALVFCLSAAQTAQADDFTARMATGRAAAATPAGTAFAQSLMPMLHVIDALCDPPGTVLPSAALGPLDLVGDITPQGALTNVQTRPQTALSACLARNLQARRFSPPPWQGDYPVFIRLTVSN